mmetsp:Transcript_1040/g.2973  ORF Transcript_1040/g.2973 Transcript_1040/m.2973 type:complete len:200 (+) Transcript_1040:314-913(+)
MVASAPWRRASVMSATSARVGVGYWIMDSSICVATIVGFFSSRLMRMMRCCTMGTSSTGISAPRSPRATMAPSAASRIWRRRGTACADSILGRTRARSLFSSRNSLSAMRSFSCLTKESAYMSTLLAWPKRMSSQSFSVIAGRDADLPRTFRCRREVSVPASTQRVTTSVPSMVSTLKLHMPPSMRRMSPTLISLTKSS